MTTATLKSGTKGWQIAKAMYSAEYFKEHGKRLCTETGKWLKKNTVFDVVNHDDVWAYTADGEFVGPMIPMEFMILHSALLANKSI